MCGRCYATSHFLSTVLYQFWLITYDIILMQLGIGQEIFPITYYPLPITGLHRYDINHENV
ncbi:hypothetical protein FJSC11DRAFT_0484 [Fischerella thermalis JSC-11]|uniref:Uncharacterized protein n=1 Tax=Fischerella thermalis JSC-11 TaxID=741277 RepID=G6FNN7_9CYAN|nr:hypothetical protein FJSC11DRAFT_0484 [Fischerella thermalis JSC-11]